MARPPTLSELSSLGTDTIDLSDALPHAQRARAVELRETHHPKDLKKLTRIFRLSVFAKAEVPAILGELKHLRSLSIVGPGLRTVPVAIFKLPRLEFLFLEGTRLEDLAGLEHSTSLRTVIFRNTPLEKNAAKREQLLARLSTKGWAADSMFKSNGFARSVATSGKVDTKNKSALLRAINDDALPDGIGLAKVNLSGGTFEDALISFSLERANLEKTTWRRCDFETNMEGANLTGAVFEDCAFDDVAMTGAKAAGAVFRRCEIRLDMSEADVTGARFTDNEPSPALNLTEAKAQRMVLEVTTLSESSLDVDLSDADLRGATIRVDITPERRKELATKANKKVKWAQLDMSGAKQDGATTIEMAPLPGAITPTAQPIKKKAAAAKAGPKTVAEYVGRIDATNAAMWFLAMDAKEAAAWKGEDEEEFDRAMEVESGGIKVGSQRGVLAEMGDCGWSHVWRVANGDLLLVEHRRSGIYSKMSKPEQIAALGERVAAFQVPKKTTRIGKVSVESGVLALMLPYCNGDFTPKELASATASGGGRLLVKAPNGDYEISSCPFAERDFEDELGSYGDVTRIARVGGGAVAKEAPATQPAKRKKSNGARRFELVEGTSSKFWEIQLDGTSFTTRYGRLGTDGQETKKSWPDARRALTEYEKLVTEKTKKGYAEV